MIWRFFANLTRPLSSVRMTRCSDWPEWLKVLIFLPHGLVGFCAFWLWWPKSAEGRKKFGIVAAYLFVFYLVMRFVFKCW